MPRAHMRRTRDSTRNSRTQTKKSISTSTSCPLSDPSCKCRIKDSYLTYLRCMRQGDAWILSGNICSLSSKKQLVFPSMLGADQTSVICFTTCSSCRSSRLLKPDNGQQTKIPFDNLLTVVTELLPFLSKSST